MIEYFKGLFTKPDYLWTTLDKLSMSGLIIGIIIIFLVICFGMYMIYVIICDRKHNKCQNKKIDGFNSWDCQNKKCMFCKNYKNKHKNKNKNQN